MSIYFASDLHLGAKYIKDHRAHEARIVSWLDSIKADASALYILGDVFDYWFEYGSVVPKGYVRFLGKIAELVDAGIDVHFFTGNHDVWMFSYLQKEIGITVHTSQIEVPLGNHRFVLGHGDDIGFDRWYHFMMLIFHTRFLQVLYRWLHPDIATWIADTWSVHSRMAHQKEEQSPNFKPRPLEDEYQVRYARQQVAQGSQADFFIFGHRHEIFDVTLSQKGQRLLVIGDWFRHFSYAVYDGTTVQIKTWNK